MNKYTTLKNTEIKEATIDNLVKMNQSELKKFLYSYLLKHNYSPINKDGFLYAEGSDPVLLVAHLDTVHKTTVKTICKSDDGNIIMSPEGIGGDDRCGVFAITEIIRTHKPCVLFCEDEETGCRGAYKYIEGTKINKDLIPNVNFIVEIDRAGHSEAVFYNCDNPKFTEYILSYGFKECYGSFTDISVVAPALKVAAVNISSGYYNAHTLHEYVVISELRNNINKIKDMIEASNLFVEPFEYIEGTCIAGGSYSAYSGLCESFYGGYYDDLEDYDESYHIMHIDDCICSMSLPSAEEHFKQNNIKEISRSDIFEVECNNIYECCGYVYDCTTDEYRNDSNLFFGNDEIVYELFKTKDGKSIAIPRPEYLVFSEDETEMFFGTACTVYVLNTIWV